MLDDVGPTMLHLFEQARTVDYEFYDMSKYVVVLIVYKHFKQRGISSQVVASKYMATSSRTGNNLFFLERRHNFEARHLKSA